MQALLIQNSVCIPPVISSSMSIWVERTHRKINAVSEHFHNALNTGPGTYKPQNPLTRTVLFFSKTLIRMYKKNLKSIKRYIWHIETKFHIYEFLIHEVHLNDVDKKTQLDVTFCMLYFSSNNCSTCFGQPCVHHQGLTTAWCYSLVLVCAVAAGRLSSPVGR